jgi:hypothetical protein
MMPIRNCPTTAQASCRSKNGANYSATEYL